MYTGGGGPVRDCTCCCILGRGVQCGGVHNGRAIFLIHY